MSTTPHESSHSENRRPWNEDNAQIVLVLVGLIASGKSTFAKALEQHFPEFRQCNQDDLGDRKAVEHLARMSLQQGLSVCIDRTNFDETQRVHWIRIAREFPHTRLWCIICEHIAQKDHMKHKIVTNTDYKQLTRRSISAGKDFKALSLFNAGTDHPTIRSPEQGIGVLYRFKSMFVPPSADEGFEHILRIRPDGHSSAEYTRDELQTLLVRVATSPPPSRSAAQRNIREYFDAVTPRVVEKGFNRGNRSSSRWPSGRGTSARRGSGGNVSSLRPLDSGRLLSSDSWQTGLVSTRNTGREYLEEAGDAFQRDGRISKAAEQARNSNSRHAADRMVPSKRSGDGTPENPIPID